jgi:3-hydroxyisobutyrate dehydrogenase/glyoxylate/succinic semialdehyde reductase
VGGEAADFEACQPLFKAMGSEAIHIGGYGMGITMKMVINLIIGEAMLAFGEALVLGEAMGLSCQYLLELILGSHVTAPFLNTKRAKIASDQYDADFPLKLMEKDLQIATTTAYEKRVAIPAAGMAKEIYALAVVTA